MACDMDPGQTSCLCLQVWREHIILVPCVTMWRTLWHQSDPATGVAVGMVARHGRRCPKVCLAMPHLHTAGSIESTYSTWSFGEASATTDDIPDHVGPRTSFDRTVYYMVIIDHASRFMVAIEVADLTGKTTKDVLRQSWVSMFQAPEAVLTDRGPAFREAEFEE